ncbi:MAG: DUF2207 domain-containing protein [Sneathiella sp.]|nr:DUF2207 domain-containing protein [Sneathiella sp.]
MSNLIDPNARRRIGGIVHGSILHVFIGFAVLFLAGFFVSSEASAREIIKDFKSDIWVQADATVRVRETITVISEGNQIRRGIYRDFPTDYKDQYGNSLRVGFDVEKVTRDGKVEPFHTAKQSNGIRVYIGDKDVLIPNGEHVYTLTYKTSRQIGYFDGFDELYWNVTGTGWDFEIEEASGRIHLPEGARILNFSGYTGYQGDQGKAFSIREYSDGMEFYTTKPLLSQQGLTIAVSWPPGFVSKPSDLDEITYTFKDNAILFAGVAGILVLLIYYLLVWLKVGRDPAPGTIIPLFEPPNGYSPAAMRYITKMGFDNKTFAAAVVSMAVKGFLKITEDSSGIYTLTKTGTETPLSMGEKAVARALFYGGGKEITLKQKNHKTLQSSRDGLKEWLRTEFEKNYFNTNRRFFIPGIGISIIVFALMVIWARDPAGAAFITLWLTGWTAGIYFLIRRAWRAWQVVLSGGGATAFVGALFATVFAVPFVIGEFVGLTFFIDTTSPAAAILFVLIQVINLVFYHLLKAPTLLGRQMMDKFAGFADFLSVTEKDRMNFFNPPDRTPELFERYLPFAMALDVEQAWGDQFSAAFAAVGEGPWRRGKYRPGWYSGRHFNPANVGAFSSSLGSGFTSAISSASTAPGSSSGSSGGGSSGGGGGGGGGGGW